MAVSLIGPSKLTDEFFDMTRGSNDESWFFVFTGQDYGSSYKVHYLPTILFQKQIVKKFQQRSKVVWCVRLELTYKNLDMLIDKSGEREMYFESMFGNVDSLVPMFKMPVLLKGQTQYNISPDDFSGRVGLMFDNIQLKIVKKKDINVVLIRFQEC